MLVLHLLRLQLIQKLPQIITLDEQTTYKCTDTVVIIFAATTGNNYNRSIGILIKHIW